MAELEIDREDIRDGKKWRRNIMKKEESPTISENGL